MQFPLLVYKSASNHVPANDMDEFDALIADGWFATVPEALEGKRAEPKDDAPPTREELKSKADELGIEYGNAIGNAKLAELIAEKLKD